MKKTKALFLLGGLMVSLLVSGCGAANEATGTKDTNVKNEQSNEDTSKKDSETASKEIADIEALAAEASFNINWYTKDGEYSSGTSFILDSKVHGEKLLVTAFHFLWPEDADTFTGSQLPDFVMGGEVYSLSDFETVQATLKNCVIIEDADAAPVVNKDVAAFTLHGADDLRTLPLAESVEAGENVYLLAGLWDTEDIHENNVYEGKVIDTEDGVLFYSLDGKPGTAGASGGPIVNEYGEVVAIHIGRGGGTYMGHTAASFIEQIDKGTISEIVYPEVMKEESETGSSEEVVYTGFAREDQIPAFFFDFQIDSIALADKIQDVECNEGYQFVVMDVTLKAPEGVTEPVDMYYYDFALEWEEEYCYPLESGLTETQLPDEYTITEQPTKGQLVFMAPTNKDVVYLTLLYDVLGVSDSGEIDGTYCAVEIPLENWTR